MPLQTGYNSVVKQNLQQFGSGMVNNTSLFPAGGALKTQYAQVYNSSALA